MTTVLCATLTLGPSAAADRAATLRALETIRADELRRHVDVLSDDTFEGREAGSRGGHAAAGYVVEQLTRYNLAPAGVDGGYFQPFPGGRNILAMIRGRDPERANEVVLVGAHYDHVGYGTPRNSYGPFGYIHNGADDNASGTAGLLEMAEALMTLPERPRRSVLIVFWDGEEKGLIGSKHWASTPTVPLDRIALAINLDMIGRLTDSKVEVYGSRTTFGLRQLVSRANGGGDLRMDFTWKLEANSDHYSFYERRIPVLMFHTGLHGDYHRPSDDAHKINPEGMQQVSRLLFNTVLALADGEDRPAFRAAAGREPSPAASFASKPSVPAPRFGVVWKADDAGGFVLTQVVENSPADRAGLQVGDRLLAFNGRRLETEEAFRIDVLGSPTNATATVVRAGAPSDNAPQDANEADSGGNGDNPAVEVNIQLDGRPTRLGVRWTNDDAEPGSVILTEVIAGSAADVAGLMPGDRIYEIAGQNFRDSEDFKNLALSLPSPLELLAEREGRLSLRTLPVPPSEPDPASPVQAGGE